MPDIDEDEEDVDEDDVRLVSFIMFFDGFVVAVVVAAVDVLNDSFLTLHLVSLVEEELDSADSVLADVLAAVVVVV